jgi:hypothetical protein
MFDFTKKNLVDGLSLKESLKERVKFSIENNNGNTNIMFGSVYVTLKLKGIKQDLLYNIKDVMEDNYELEIDENNNLIASNKVEKNN